MRLSASANELDAIHTEWLSYYNRYRQLCIECHLWNEQIDEKVPFMPSDTQIAKELALYRKFEQLYNDAKISLAARVQAPMRIDAEQELKFAAFRDMMDDIYAYLDAQRGHFAIRYMMLHDLSRDNKKSKDKYAKLCADMVSYGMLAESKNDSGYYVIKKISNRQSSADSEIHDGTKKFESTANSQIPENTLKCELPPSKYNKSFYASLSDSDGYRAKYTVGTPESLNKTTNNCEFTSTSCGIRYQTSLERCTCPAFSRNQAIPCKHMIALAAYLGYYKLPGQASDPVIKLDPIPSYDQNPSA